MLELLKSYCVDAVKLITAGVVIYAFVQSQESPENLLIPGIAVVAVLIAISFLTQYFIKKTNKK